MWSWYEARDTGSWNKEILMLLAAIYKDRLGGIKGCSASCGRRFDIDEALLAG